MMAVVSVSMSRTSSELKSAEYSGGGDGQDRLFLLRRRDVENNDTGSDSALCLFFSIFFVAGRLLLHRDVRA